MEEVDRDRRRQFRWASGSFSRSEHSRRNNACSVKNLADTMSRYLIQRIEENPSIQLRYSSELTSLEGDGHLEQVSWIDKSSNASIHPSYPPCIRDDGRVAENRLAHRMSIPRQQRVRPHGP